VEATTARASVGSLAAAVLDVLPSTMTGSIEHLFVFGK